MILPHLLILNRFWLLNSVLGLLPSGCMFDGTTILLAAIGVLFIGFSKAGFGGGLGMLTTPICVLAFSAEGIGAVFAIGILLPLRCAGDACSVYHCWVTV